jgi:hypothetical protein
MNGLLVEHIEGSALLDLASAELCCVIGCSLLVLHVLGIVNNVLATRARPLFVHVLGRRALNPKDAC